MNHSYDKCICPSCGREAEIALAKCGSCDASLMLNERYRLLTVLGHNTGVTYLAHDTRPDAFVVIKELSVQKLSAWKEHELFHREMNVLKQLSHPGIPRFLDNFSLTLGKQEIFYFVQEYRPGKNLKAGMEGHRFTEKEVIDLIQKVAEILAYLQDVRPPVIHRDIKPSNVLCAQDGSVSLIDFGAVVDIVKPDNQGSTVAGTFGFMAPEQLYGRASSKTDIYSLGMTAIVLLSRKNPEEMLGPDNELDWESHVELEKPVRELLKKMTAIPAAERPDATKVIEYITRIREGREMSGSGISFLDSGAPVTDNVSYPLFAKQAIESWKGRSSPESVPDEETEPAKTGVAWWAGIVVLLLVGFIGIIVASNKNPNGSEARENQEQTKLEQLYLDLPATRDHVPVPLGIKELSFGMSLAEVALTMPEAAKGERHELPEEILRSLSLSSRSMVPPGFSVTCDTFVGLYRAQCTLFFAVQNTLSKIECVLEPVSTPGAHGEVERTIMEELYQKYGREGFRRMETPSIIDPQGIDREWTWEDEGARLVFKSEYSDSSSFFGSGMDESLSEILSSKKSSLVLTNTWARHESAMDDFKRTLERQLLQEQEAKKLLEAQEIERQDELRRQEQESRRRQGADISRDL